MRALGRFLLALLLGVLIGVGSLWYMVFQAQPTQLVRNGIWQMNPLAGSAANDPYSRIRIALTSILALDRSESIYFEARTDSEGGRLSAACDYTLVGPAPKARWWSVTAYGADDMLIPTEIAKYAASAGNAEADANGSYQIALTPDGSGPNAIATGAGPFTLLLRLYQPAPEIAQAPDAATLFQLQKGSCRA